MLHGLQFFSCFMKIPSQFKASYDFIADFVLKYGCAGTDRNWLGIASI